MQTTVSRITHCLFHYNQWFLPRSCLRHFFQRQAIADASCLRRLFAVSGKHTCFSLEQGTCRRQLPPFPLPQMNERFFGPPFFLPGNCMRQLPLAVFLAKRFLVCLTQGNCRRQLLHAFVSTQTCGKTRGPDMVTFPTC